MHESRSLDDIPIIHRCLSVNDIFGVLRKPFEINYFCDFFCDRKLNGNIQSRLLPFCSFFLSFVSWIEFLFDSKPLSFLLLKCGSVETA